MVRGRDENLLWESTKGDFPGVWGNEQSFGLREDSHHFWHEWGTEGSIILVKYGNETTKH